MQQLMLLEFPNVSKEWLAEYMLLDEINTLQLKDTYTKSQSQWIISSNLKKTA